MAWHVPSTNGMPWLCGFCLPVRAKKRRQSLEDLGHWAMLPCSDHPTSGSLPKLGRPSQHMSTVCLQKSILSVPPEDPELTADQNRRHRSGEACLLNLMPAGPWSRKWHNSRSQTGNERLNISQPQKRKNQAIGWFGVRVWVSCFCWVIFRVFREYVYQCRHQEPDPASPRHGSQRSPTWSNRCKSAPQNSCGVEKC